VPERKRKSYMPGGYEQSESFCLPVLSMGVRKREKGDARRKAIDMWMVYGGFHCGLYTPVFTVS